MIMTVHDHHRRPAAPCETLFFNRQRNALVFGGLTQVYTQLVFHVGNKVLGAVEPTGDIGANIDLVLADRLLIE